MLVQYEQSQEKSSPDAWLVDAPVAVCGWRCNRPRRHQLPAQSQDQANDRGCRRLVLSERLCIAAVILTKCVPRLGLMMSLLTNLSVLACDR